MTLFWPWEGDWIPAPRETLRRQRHIVEHLHRHGELLDLILERLSPQGDLMSDLSTIANAVEAEGNVVDSAVVLLNQLSAQLSAVANDPVAVQALADQITTQATTLAAAVAANTPSAPPPGVVPSVESASPQPAPDVPPVV